jgi:hypothetical protein
MMVGVSVGAFRQGEDYQIVELKEEGGEKGENEGREKKGSEKE